ncbi:hypothetical protein M404DRAFT_372399 [Pisolithus tinctorius Marx 270]|uniref:Uncharacterized protein n=1 Tax=Pisolithus tinctorius Marx 270 TaxID=870435 RepID=A0A0C3JAP3_PISTI|nr:hypothetical protein M404DRAFT_372399 [Pisolithus tinctorius Marx 270]
MYIQLLLQHATRSVIPSNIPHVMTTSSLQILIPVKGAEKLICDAAARTVTINFSLGTVNIPIHLECVWVPS